MEIADRIVAELGIEWFFNIQLVGEHVIEVNPRISTIVYQEDFNLPYLGVKRALGEISDDELEALRACIRPGRTALRYFDQLEWDALPVASDRVSPRVSAPPGAAPRRPPRSSPGGSPAPLRIVHCPVNTAGVPWTNVQALRRRGVDASLVVFNRYAMHPEADRSLELHGSISVDRSRSGARSPSSSPAPTCSTSPSA